MTQVIATVIAAAVARAMWQLLCLLYWAWPRKTTYRIEIAEVLERQWHNEAEVTVRRIEEVVWKTELFNAEARKHLPELGSKWGNGVVHRITIND